MTLAISTRSQAAKQAKAIAETGVKDVEMTEAVADTEPAPLTTMPPTDADVTEAEVLDAEDPNTEAPDTDGLGQPEGLSSQNLPLDPKDKALPSPWTRMKNPSTLAINLG
ncbi:hypothetical protein AALP_AAs44880U000100 [Arabis alpina]|uniref:Uncharacterized protein n=1 Tax=Arabis alpina TaxID=50452 RepID=A0A087G234_ARAAL|nr:hypothetical protein AALP_AAs44880U000100 [Arabis alpina]